MHWKLVRSVLELEMQLEGSDSKGATRKVQWSDELEVRARIDLRP